jgi:hypothetical protein
MSIVRNLLYFILANLIIASPQINLHLTDCVSNTENNIELQHDCLYTAAAIDKEKERHQIISYCMSEWPSKWDMKDNGLYQKFTFAELHNKQITSEELYLWSAPMDVVESYQHYVNPSSTWEKTAITTAVFYNCTLPRFGPICQYEFENDPSHYITLDEIIDDYYLQHKYEPTTLTCYTHLQCNRGSAPACLDWSDICDGKVDCLDDGNDEKHCWQLEMNECADNQYRCLNGQCIPYDFFLDDPIAPDCLDGSDERMYRDISQQCKTAEPTFMCEDITCTVARSRFRTPLTSSCVEERSRLIGQAMFPNRSMLLPESCWLAFKCILHMPIPRDPICLNLCSNGACDEIIRKTCPDMLFIPPTPVLFGHVYSAYEKNESRYSTYLPLLPQYICYNNQLCGKFFKDKTSLSFNNSTCYRRTDFPISFINSGRSNWADTFLLPTSRLFSACDSFVNGKATYCNRTTMYQCINVTKCVSIYRLRDGVIDCFYGDDEDSNIISNLSSTGLLKRHFKCTTTNEYISYHLVENGMCDCRTYDNDLCDDENAEIRYQRNHILFQTICDGFVELVPISINGRNETDETECEQWLCNNTYTRCDGIWNCFNGADEIDCDPSPLIDCPLHHHICVSPTMNQLMCLTIERANDDEIDCLGATDEPKLCRSNDYQPVSDDFYCKNYGSGSCITSGFLCDMYDGCPYGDDEQACDWTRNFTYKSNHSRVDTFFRAHFNEHKQSIVYFSLNESSNSIRSMTKHPRTELSSRPSNNPTIHSHRQRCHRGIDLRVWLDNEKNITNNTCLCPPSFYGDICQYQNQRVSLTIQFQALSDSWRILFSVVISLIDDTDQRIVHSYEQFSYLPMRDCQIKFHHYLLYSTRPKNADKQYSVHIDIYETVSLAYRGSFLLPIIFPFLPVHRIAVQFDIPHNNRSIESCPDHQCIHGKCMRYFGDQANTTFCQCYRGWAGRYCTISYNCSCSLDSICIGISAYNRSMCVCPMDKFGSRCLLDKTVCRLKGNATCLNGGQCISVDKHGMSSKNFTCICPKGFSGDRCEIADTKIIVTFHKDIILPQSILVHFIQVIINGPPERTTTYNAIPFTQNVVTIYWSHPFHIAFLELPSKSYYLTVLQKTYNQSLTIAKTLEPTDRCKHINELFSDTIVKLHLLRRIKYYHIPCQTHSPSLSCFYDDVHLCLCDNFGQQRQANCFEFDHQMKFNCSGQGSCENGAQCFQDSPNCPKTSICICPTCFYGRQCQFSTSGFGLSLDAILGYKILPQIPISHQPLIIQISIFMTVVITFIGLINGILSLITFSSKKLREVGCGFYLLGSSITTLLTMVMFVLKFSILLSTQIERIHNRSFLYFQCISIDFLLQICLRMDQWLNACIAIERAVTALKGPKFEKRKSRQMAKYIILILLFLTTITAIHDPIHRRLLYDNDDGNMEKKRIWCIVAYSSRIQVYNSVINIFHFFIPFFINLISAFIIIKKKAQQRATIQSDQTYNQILHNQFQQHRHLIIAPLLLVVLAIPRVILTLVSGCMTSVRDSWIFLTGYFISFIPSMLTCVVFVLPSKLYKDQLRRSFNRYRQNILNRLRLLATSVYRHS